MKRSCETCYKKQAGTCKPNNVRGPHGWCWIPTAAQTRNLMAEIAKLQAEIERLREAQRWIPVTERLPDNCNTVLTSLSHKMVCEGSYFDVDGTWGRFSVSNMPVTHWRPLPEPPKE